ncbi:MAG: BlaI/MecI/CopY family transcriptional regulator [Nanoarchaeota archaeon]
MKELVTKFDDILSPLESDVLAIIWPNKQMKVREIYEQLKKKRKVALSSVAVILDRLHDKKIVMRTEEVARGGTRYTYSPAEDKKTFEKNVVEEAVNNLIESFGPVAVNYFNDRFSKKK